jgi:hypothetical protein
MIELKVNGNKLSFFNGFGFSSRIDTIASSVSFNSFLNIDAFDYANIEVKRDGVLIFTGEIINKSVPKQTPPKPFGYKAESLPHILSCTLPTEAYPLQLENSTLKDIIEFICSFFEVVVVFDQSTETEANESYELSDLKLAQPAGNIINELVTNVGLVLTHDAPGRLIVTKDISQSEITLPRFTSDNKSYDLKKFYHNYIALGQAPIGESDDIQAIARFDNIDPRRNITKIQDSGGIATIEKKAEGMRADSLKAIKQTLSFNNFFCNVGDYVFEGDHKLIINEINYSNVVGSEISTISLIDSQIYER